MFSARQPFLTFLPLLAAASVAFAQEGNGQLWTTKPTHIDPATQHYERLPARVAAKDSRSWLVVPERIKVLDSTSFSFGDGVYVIADVDPVRAKRLCQAIEGGRWNCGRMASIFLGNLVRGKRLLCDMKQTGKKILLGRCVIGSRDVAAAIVREGYGKARNDAALLAVQAEAQKAAEKGLWRNPKCTGDFDGC